MLPRKQNTKAETPFVTQEEKKQVVGAHKPHSTLVKVSTFHMAGYNTFIHPLIIILRILGLWLVPVKPKEKHSIFRILSNIFCVLITIFNVCDLMRHIRYSFSYSELSTTVTVSIVREIWFLFTRLSLVHFSFSAHPTLTLRYQNLKTKCAKCVGGYKRNSWILYWITCSSLFSLLFYLTYERISEKLCCTETVIDHYKTLAITGSDFEAILFFTSAVAVDLSGAVLLPTLLILTFSIVVCNQFEVIENELIRTRSSKQLYISECSVIGSLKDKIFTICDFVKTVDEAFRYYVIFALVDVGITVFNVVYFWQLPNCYDKILFVAILLYEGLAIFVLCVSGKNFVYGVSNSKSFVHVVLDPPEQ